MGSMLLSFKYIVRSLFHVSEPLGRIEHIISHTWTCVERDWVSLDRLLLSAEVWTWFAMGRASLDGALTAVQIKETCRHL